MNDRYKCGHDRHEGSCSKCFCETPRRAPCVCEVKNRKWDKRSKTCFWCQGAVAEERFLTQPHWVMASDGSGNAVVRYVKVDPRGDKHEPAADAVRDRAEELRERMAIEKRQLIEELDAAGVKFETIELVKKELGIGAEPDRFAEMPKDGTQFWFINLSGEIISAVWQDCQVYGNYWQRGNCFPTREAAEHSLKAGKYAEDIAWETIKRTAAKYPQPTAEDWALGKEAAYPIYNHDLQVVDVEHTKFIQESQLPHFLVTDDAVVFAAECEAEIKLVMGVQMSIRSEYAAGPRNVAKHIKPEDLEKHEPAADADPCEEAFQRCKRENEGKGWGPERDSFEEGYQHAAAELAQARAEIDRLKGRISLSEVRNLNAWQRSDLVHPYTCGSGNRTDEKHIDGEGVLIATETCWICPFCDYSQEYREEILPPKAAALEADAEGGTR